MRVVIDLQGAQASNAKRGIGRYSLALAKEIAIQRGSHEVFIALNGLLPDRIQSIRSSFSNILPAENICVWDADGHVNSVDRTLDTNRQVAEITREVFLAHMKPDVLLITSTFEGLGDNSILSIGRLKKDYLTAVVLYDLIPLIHKDIYLKNPAIERWYFNKLDHLRRADLLLCISESAQKEAIDHLGFPSEQTENISTACDENFRPLKLKDADYLYLNTTYKLSREFVMYTGGIDHRKNIEGLIRSYAKLSPVVRSQHQLAIVCAMQPEDRAKLQLLADQEDLSSDELVMTGFIPDEDLLKLYNACKLFVFPSWHEGFGLPALEAMTCGKAVIGSNTSSIPEVIGRPDALFDPFDDDSITAKIQSVLVNSDFQKNLEDHGLIQSKKFSWGQTAQTSWRALDNLLFAQKSCSAELKTRLIKRRPRLAYFSPLPPEKSGISGYSAELLPELSRHYEIDVIVAQGQVIDGWISANCPIRTIEWFRKSADCFDRIMYHFGNSHFHSHMFDLMAEFPGIIVLHDFFLSGVLFHNDINGITPHSWARAISLSHGWSALQSRYENPDANEVMMQYPCNLDVLKQALGIIVHSNYSCHLAREWYGQTAADEWSVIPLLRVRLPSMSKKEAREILGLGEEDFIVCNFGLVGPTKLNHRLLSAWLASPISANKRCCLVFVGQNHGGEYGHELLRVIRSNNKNTRVEITGWIDDKLYRTWLAAADVGVQLRTLTRGETSATVLDCMNANLATIVNANGSMADLDKNAVWMLDDNFTDQQLSNAITKLYTDSCIRETFGNRAASIIKTEHQPRNCAEQYANAIECHYERNSLQVSKLLSLALDRNTNTNDIDIKVVAQTLANNLPPKIRKRQILLDISGIINENNIENISNEITEYLKLLLLNTKKDFDVSAIYITSDKKEYRYSRQFISKLLNVYSGWADDEIVDLWPGDIFLGLCPSFNISPEIKKQMNKWHERGIYITHLVKILPSTSDKAAPNNSLEYQNWIKFISTFNNVLCTSRDVADDLYSWLQVFGEKRDAPFALKCQKPNEIIAGPISTIGNVKVDQLLQLLLKEPPYKNWMHDGIQRFHGSDYRLHTQVGKRLGNSMHATGQAGFLVFGPHTPLNAGSYEVQLKGEAYSAISGCWIDVSFDSGKQRLSYSEIKDTNTKNQWRISVPISLINSVKDLEIRLWVQESADINLENISILPNIFEN